VVRTDCSRLRPGGFTAAEELMVCSGQEVEWAPELTWLLRRRENL